MLDKLIPATQTALVFVAGINSTILAAVIGGVFLVINTVVTLVFSARQRHDDSAWQRAVAEHWSREDASRTSPGGDSGDYRGGGNSRPHPQSDGGAGADQ